MTFEQLQKANATIKPTDIKGKDYAEVNQRIKAFRMLYPEGSIITELVSDDGDICIFRAIIKNSELVLGTGTAFEKRDASFINKTSYIENCETSAVGRALAMCGIGIDVSVASYEEVANAINNQSKKPDSKPKKSEAVAEAELKARVLKYVNKRTKKYIEGVMQRYGVDSLNKLTAKDCEDFIKCIEEKGGNIDE